MANNKYRIKKHKVKVKKNKLKANKRKFKEFLFWKSLVKKITIKLNKLMLRSYTVSKDDITDENWAIVKKN